MAEHTNPDLKKFRVVIRRPVIEHHVLLVHTTTQSEAKLLVINELARMGRDFFKQKNVTPVRRDDDVALVRPGHITVQKEV